MQIRIVDERIATFPVTVAGTNEIAFYDTSPSISCMSVVWYQIKRSPTFVECSSPVCIVCNWTWIKPHRIDTLWNCIEPCAIYAYFHHMQKSENETGYRVRYATSTSFRFWIHRKWSYVPTLRCRYINYPNKHHFNWMLVTNYQSYRNNSLFYIHDTYRKIWHCYLKYTKYVYGQVNEIWITKNPHLVMLSTIHLKNETEPEQVPVTLANLSVDPTQLTNAYPRWIPLTVY